MQTFFMLGVWYCTLFLEQLYILPVECRVPADSLSHCSALLWVTPHQRFDKTWICIAPHWFFDQIQIDLGHFMFSFKHGWVAREDQTRGLRVLSLCVTISRYFRSKNPTVDRTEVFYSSWSLGIILNCKIINLWPLKHEILVSFP